MSQYEKSYLTKILHFVKKWLVEQEERNRKHVLLRYTEETSNFNQVISQQMTQKC